MIEFLTNATELFRRNNSHSFGKSNFLTITQKFLPVFLQQSWGDDVNWSCKNDGLGWGRQPGGGHPVHPHLHHRHHQSPKLYLILQICQGCVLLAFLPSMTNMTARDREWMRGFIRGLRDGSNDAAIRQVIFKSCNWSDMHPHWGFPSRGEVSPRMFVVHRDDIPANFQVILHFIKQSGHT